MEDKITLDKAAFKALASETRVSLLKKLGNRRATPSELAASLGISAQAASEHLAQLDKAGLVKRDARPEDEGRKWVYYSLTDKGSALVRPTEQRKIWVLLSVAALLLAFGAFSFYGAPVYGIGGMGAAAPASAPAALQRAAENAPPVPESFGEKAGAVALNSEVSESGVAESAESGLTEDVEKASFDSSALIGLTALAGGLLLLAAAAYYYLESKRSRKKIGKL